MTCCFVLYMCGTDFMGENHGEIFDPDGCKLVKNPDPAVAHKNHPLPYRCFGRRVMSEGPGLDKVDKFESQKVLI